MRTTLLTLILLAQHDLASALITNSSRDKQYEDHFRFLKRDDPKCPEDIGAPMWSCQFDFCGGEDPQNKGFCTKSNASGGKCKCIVIPVNILIDF
jgi:hypothetical protein